MPIYEFRCEACGLIQEYLLRLGQGPEGLSCRGCGASRLAKQLSTFATGNGGDSLPSMPCGSSGGCGSGFS